MQPVAHLIVVSYEVRHAGMDLLTVAIAIGLLLIAIGIGHKDKGSWPILIGFAVVACAGIARVWSGNGPIQVLIELSRDCGISLLLAATYMGVRKLADSARPFVILGLSCLLLSGLLFGVTYLWKSIWHQSTHSILVELGPDDSILEVEGILSRDAHGWEKAFPAVALSEDIDLAQIYLVYVSSNRVQPLMETLQADSENVDHVELNLEFSLSLPSSEEAQFESEVNRIGNDPYAERQWALDAVHMHQAHQILETAKPLRKARVAILDTGVESDHEDLQSVYAGGVQGDTHGHGTHCAGLVGAVTNNGLGIASLNWEGRFIDVLGFRALSETGQGSVELIAQAIIDATKAGVDVISMSLGSKAAQQPSVLIHAVDYALERGVIAVASAGNSNEDALDHFPSNIEGVIAVAAVDHDFQKAEFSNRIGSLSRPLAAPGVDIYSTYLTDSYQSMSGTSMAAPVVAGLIGVMRAMNPDLTSEEVYHLLYITGREIPDTPQTGRLIHARAALEQVIGIAS